MAKKNTKKKTPKAAEVAPPDENRADIWFLLDRSGSMASIADDVIGGFNTFFAEQKAEPGDAVVSIIQFDSNDPQETLVNRRPITDVRPLSPRSFQPRGGTPLLDALGDLLDRAEAVAQHDADQLVVVLTDGHENASHRWTRDDLFGRISKLTAKGWTFVFLGANQDSYAEAHDLAMAAGNTSNFAADSQGVHKAFAGTSRATQGVAGQVTAGPGGVEPGVLGRHQGSGGVVTGPLRPQPDELAEETNLHAARSTRAWLTGRGLAAEIDRLHAPDDGGLIPTPGLEDLLDDLGDACLAACNAADTVFALLDDDMDADTVTAAVTAVGTCQHSRPRRAEHAMRRIAEILLGVSTRSAPSDTVARAERRGRGHPGVTSRRRRTWSTTA